MSLITVSKALHTYFSHFGNAFLENSVPSGVKFPYLTYNVPVSKTFEPQLVQVRIWDRSTSFLTVNTLSDKIAYDIGYGKLIPCEDGNMIWLYAGDPFQTPVSDEDDVTLKCVNMNIIIQ